MNRVECSTCETMFKSRFRDTEGLECPACRASDRDRREPPEVGCPNDDCDRDDDPLSQRELRSMSGQSFSAQVCVIESGDVLIHAGDE